MTQMKTIGQIYGKILGGVIKSYRNMIWENCNFGRRKREIGEKIYISKDVIETYGGEFKNINGHRLVNFCIENTILIANTFLKHNDFHKYTIEITAESKSQY